MSEEGELSLLLMLEKDHDESPFAASRLIGLCSGWVLRSLDLKPHLNSTLSVACFTISELAAVLANRLFSKV